MSEHPPHPQENVAINPKLIADLDAQCSSILERLRSLRGLDFAVEADRREALAEIRCLLGRLALFRQRLGHASSSAAHALRQAA